MRVTGLEGLALVSRFRLGWGFSWVSWEYHVQEEVHKDRNPVKGASRSFCDIQGLNCLAYDLDWEAKERGSQLKFCLGEATYNRGVCRLV